MVKTRGRSRVARRKGHSLALLVLARGKPADAAQQSSKRRLEIADAVPAEDLWAYCLAFDPFILSEIRSIPRLGIESDITEKDAPDIAIVPHRELGAPGRNLALRAEAGKGVILVMPDEELRSSLAGLKNCRVHAELVACRERWAIDRGSGRSYLIPEGPKYLGVAAEGARVLSQVGESPAFIVDGRVGFFTLDAFGLMRHLQFQNPVGPARDVSFLLVLAVKELLGSAADERLQRKIRDAEELRRDFHSFGLTLYKVRELAWRAGRERSLRTDDCEVAVLQAADSLARGSAARARSQLEHAFKALAGAASTVLPLPKLLVDSLHGGLLLGDMGFAGFDWPEQAAQNLHSALDLVEKRKYRFTLEVMAHSLENLLPRYPQLHARLKALWAKGSIEIVDGTFAQPLGHFYSLESNIRHFESGLRVIQRLFGRGPVTYALKEFSFSPQMPALLRSCGYRFAVLRASSGGRTPPELAGHVRWQGSDGEEIAALPNYHSESQSEKVAQGMYAALPGVLVEEYRAGYPRAVVSNHNDLLFWPPFREELVRAAFYAPALGEFSTYENALREAAEGDPVRSYRMDEFEHAPFLNPESPSRRAQGWDGRQFKNFTKAVQAETCFLSAEVMAASVAVAGGIMAVNLEPHWQALNVWQAHDVVLTPGLVTGSLQHGPAGGYAGPRGDTALADRVGDELGRRFEEASSWMDGTLVELAGLLGMKQSSSGEHTKSRAFLAFNPVPVRRLVALRVPDAAVKLQLKGEPLLCQRLEKGTLVSVELPPSGYVIVQSAPTMPAGSLKQKSKVSASRNKLENEFLTVHLDAATGAVARVLDKKARASVLQGRGNELVYGSDSKMVASRIEVLEAGPVRGIVRSNGRVVRRSGPTCNFRTTVTLEAGSRIISFLTELEPSQPVTGKDWDDSVRARFRFAEGGPRKIFRNTLHVMEETKHRRYSSFAFTRYTPGRFSVDLFNQGNQYYAASGPALENFLLLENQPLDPIRYALAVNVPFPYQESLAWQAPVLVTEVQGIAGQDARGSFFSVEPGNVHLASLRFRGGRLIVRVAETRGKETQAVMRLRSRVEWAYHTDFVGKNLERLAVSESEIRFSLSPWQVKQLAVAPSGLADVSGARS